MIGAFCHERVPGFRRLYNLFWKIVLEHPSKRTLRRQRDNALAIRDILTLEAVRRRREQVDLAEFLKVNRERWFQTAIGNQSATRSEYREGDSYWLGRMDGLIEVQNWLEGYDAKRPGDRQTIRNG